MKQLFLVFLIILTVDINYSQKIYCTSNLGNKLTVFPISGTPDTLLASNQAGIYGVEVDINNGKLFWSLTPGDKILSSNLSGNNPVVILNASDGLNAPRGLALDPGNSKIYWVESLSGSLKRADYDGTNVETVISNLKSPVDVAYDGINNKLYWSENGIGTKRICSADQDGSNITVLVDGLKQVGGIDIDIEDGKIFWSDFEKDKIFSAVIGGSVADSFSVGSNHSPRGVSLDLENLKIVWTDTKTDSIQQADFDGSNKTNIAVTSGNPMMLKFTDSGNPMPVELTAFNAIVLGNKVNLNWKTETEVDNYGFEIEKKSFDADASSLGHLSSDGWKKIGFIKGAGNSYTENQYSFTDNLTVPAGRQDLTLNLNPTYVYRLKQIDLDGKITYSKEVEVKVENIPTEFVLEQNYPNPFNPTTTIKYSLPAASRVTLNVFNLLGQEVATLVNKEQPAGSYEVKFDAGNLASGVYLYKLSAGEYTATKKLTLMK